MKKENAKKAMYDETINKKNLDGYSTKLQTCDSIEKIDFFGLMFYTHFDTKNNHEILVRYNEFLNSARTLLHVQISLC